MERRNRSLEALNKLCYIDSLDDYDKASALEQWVLKYLNGTFEEEFDLRLDDLKKLSELFYKNIHFLKEHTIHIKQELENHNNIKKFFS
jgi:hypothetical protein